MTRNNKYLLAFAAAVLIPVVLIWYVAWPILRPWHLPDVTQGTLMQQGPERALTADEVARVNQWLHHTQTGWGVSGETPPEHVAPERLFHMQTADGGSVILSVWHFRHGEDVVGIQIKSDGPYRMRSFDRDTLQLPTISPGQS